MLTEPGVVAVHPPPSILTILFLYLFLYLFIYTIILTVRHTHTHSCTLSIVLYIYNISIISLLLCDINITLTGGIQDTIDSASKLIGNLSDIQRERLSKEPVLDDRGHYVLPSPSEQELKTGLSGLAFVVIMIVPPLSLSLSFPLSSSLSQYLHSLHSWYRLLLR